MKVKNRHHDADLVPQWCGGGSWHCAGPSGMVVLATALSALGRSLFTLSKRPVPYTWRQVALAGLPAVPSSEGLEGVSLLGVISDPVRPSRIPSLCTHVARAGIEWRR